MQGETIVKRYFVIMIVRCMGHVILKECANVKQDIQAQIVVFFK
jgi:hypothetical protein